MGDAFTAVTDDEYTLFYNPAALASSEKVRITPLNVTLGLTNLLDDMDRFQNFPSDAVGVANKIMDFPIYTQLGTAPGFKMGAFALSLIANTSASIVLRNAIHPFLDVDYRYDKGVIMGYGHSIGSGAKKVKGRLTSGLRLSFGASVKSVSREGLQGSFSFFGTDLLNAVGGAKDFNGIRRKLGYSKGQGFGVDLGTELAFSSSNYIMKSGFSILDVADTKFSRSEGFRDIPNQKMAMNWGSSFSQKFFLFDYTLAFDIHPLNSSADLSSKIHLGASIALPGLELFAGFNGGYSSYGATIKLWPISLTAGVYGVELGAKYRQNKGARAIIYLSLLDLDLDIF